MKFLTKDAGAKIIALLCAIFLWVYVSASESKVAYFPGSLPIEAKNTPAGLAAIYDEQKVKVKLQAPYETWQKISVDNLSAFVDLAGLEEGTYELDVQVTTNLPNVVIVEKEPSKIIVRIEPIATKEVPVVVKFEGEAKSGFVPGEPVVTPAKAEAKGARSLVENLSEATALIKLSGEEDDFQKTVSLAVYNEKGEKEKGIEFTPKSVEVKVPIVPASESKTVGVKVIIKGKPSSDYFVSKIESEPATVEISGSDSELKSILYIETKEVDIEGIKSNLEKYVELNPPSGISLEQKSVKVKITLSLNTTQREITATLSFNKGEGLTVTSVSPNVIKVVVAGPSNIINSLSPSNVVITFDLSGKNVGSYFINITKSMISVPLDCSATSWLPSAVTIVLQ